MWTEMPSLQCFTTQHWSPLVATSDSISPVWEEGGLEREGGGTPSHPLSIYGHEVYTQRGILSLEMMNGEEGRGSCQSVYKEKEGKSLMWNPQQANTYRGAETKRNTFNCFLHLLTQTTSDHLLKTIKRGLKENNHLHNLFYIFPSYLFPWKRRTSKCIIMLNNMDLNAKDSFYPQFENCNSSSLGMENSARKDNQEVYVDAERGVPAQFGHGEFASLHGR